MDGIQSRLAITWESPASCNMPKPCRYCSNEFGRKGLSPLSRDVSEWLSAFAWLESLYSPFYITVCYGEPFSDLDCMRVLSALSRSNKVAVYSNLVARPESLEVLDKSHLQIIASYHPLHWGAPDGFIARIERYRDCGFLISEAAVIGYPPFLPHLRLWVERLAEAGLAIRVTPFHGQYQGREYPAAFRADDLVLLGQGGPPAAEETSTPSGVAKYCSAGMESIFVKYDGDILRCYMYGSGLLGNMFRHELSVSECWQPCTEPSCPCPLEHMLG